MDKDPKVFSVLTKNMEVFLKMRKKLSKIIFYGEGERSSFLYPTLSALTQMARFTSCFSAVHKHHYATSRCQWHLPFQSNFIDMLLNVIFGCPHPLLLATSKFIDLLKTSLLSLLKTCPYHRTPLTLASPSKVSFKPYKLISSWLLLSQWSPHLALIITFSVLLKIVKVT